jgi:hypothetical protein
VSTRKIRAILEFCRDNWDEPDRDDARDALHELEAIERAAVALQDEGLVNEGVVSGLPDAAAATIRAIAKDAP